MKRRLALVLFFQIVLSFVFLLPVGARDWERYPAYVEIPFANRVAVVGDVHGAFPELEATLKVLNVARKSAAAPFKLSWCGADTTLIFVGDFCDRGKYTKEVYDAVMDLEKQASKSGGRVIALLGNHEILMLNGTVEKWAKTLKPPKKQHYQNTLDSFENAGIPFQKAISGGGKYGDWLRNRPLFAIVNGYFFAHGGLAKPPITRSDLAAVYREEIEGERWNEGIFMDQEMPLWHRDWWKDLEFVNQALQHLGARGVVFGHTVGALGNPGKIDHLENSVVSVDIGMTPAYGNSKGGGLLITIRGEKMLFRARYPDHPETILFQCPAPVGSVENPVAAGSYRYK